MKELKDFHQSYREREKALKDELSKLDAIKNISNTGFRERAALRKELISHWDEGKKKYDEMFEKTNDPNVKRAIIEAKISNDDYETAYIIGKNGEISDPITNKQKSYVSFTEEQLQSYAGKTLTHNHPRGSSFSREDIELAMDYNMQGIRAVSSNGKDVYTFRINVPKVSPTQISLAKTLINNAISTVSTELWDQIARNQITYEQAGALHWDYVWKQFMEFAETESILKGRFTYGMESITQ